MDRDRTIDRIGKMVEARCYSTGSEDGEKDRNQRIQEMAALGDGEALEISSSQSTGGNSVLILDFRFPQL